MVMNQEETHYKIIINGKEVWVSKWYKQDEFGFEGDTEFLKGKELLTDEEQEAVFNYIEEEILYT